MRFICPGLSCLPVSTLPMASLRQAVSARWTFLPSQHADCSESGYFMFSVINVKFRTERKKVNTYFSLLQMYRLDSTLSHEPKHGNIDLRSCMQYWDSLTLSFTIFSQNTKWLQSLTDAILSDLLFSIDSDPPQMKKSCMVAFWLLFSQTYFSPNIRKVLIWLNGTMDSYNRKT